MVVRVAQRAALSAATQVVVAADSPQIVKACEEHGVRVLLTQVNHPSGSDRLAEASQLLGLSAQDMVVNVQGDEPLIDPQLINDVASLLNQHPHASMSTAAHPIHDLAEFTNPNVVKVVIDQAQLAMYFSRAPIPWWRDGFAAIIENSKISNIAGSVLGPTSLSTSESSSPSRALTGRSHFPNFP
jgi:3-deoxy-manno-octulosonate cytidylyltransferase (CMP-KDO synthetase)